MGRTQETEFYARLSVNRPREQRMSLRAAIKPAKLKVRFTVSRGKSGI